MAERDVEEITPVNRPDNPDRDRPNQKLVAEETIVVKDRDMGPYELQKIFGQVSKVMRTLAANIIINNSAQGGLANPVIQHMLQCAASADQAKLMLEGPPRVMPGGGPPPTPGFGRA